MDIVQSVMTTRSVQNPARPKPRKVTHATPDSPASWETATKLV